ncbi:THO complex subunit 2-like [Hydractinia symbiolongicarpus]|uniref:THO complex subunit 2-like n=1 Tax=Hydractinia symbiolongicarpus TaxID=13093 RepID=UPI002549E9C4|nr:THO complex subunit 2-like [Hydractinia symbiolongicarpus]
MVNGARSCDNMAAIKSWNKSNRIDFLKQCEAACNGFNPSQIAEKDLRKNIRNLLWSTLEEQLSLTEAVSIFAEAANGDAALLSLFADIVAVVDLETLCLEEKAPREQFLFLLSSLGTAIPEGILKERLDPETLESARLIQSQKALNQKLVRTKTKLFYKQQKYNLLREENEGYAKLITELSQDSISSSSQEYVLNHIMSLLGFFNLDPNRVLDILLEAFECKVSEDLFFIPLIISYLSHCDISGFPQMIGFKYQFYHQSVDTVTPTSLYKLTACLLRNNLLKVEELYSHLKPSDKEIFEMNKKVIDSAKEEAKKMNAVILSDHVEKDDKNSDGKDDDIVVDNQKFGLCHALLELGAWKQALSIMERLPTNLLMSSPKIARSLSNLVHCTVEPLYRSKFCPKAALGNSYRTSRGFPAPCLEYGQLCDDVFPMLNKLGAFLSIDPTLVVKMIRVSKGFMKEYNDATDVDKEKMRLVYGGILTLLDEVLLPSMSLLECNCCVAEELWGLLKRVPYEVRYRLYATWKNHSYMYHPKLILTKAKTIKRAKYITKRLSKENVKPSGRQIGKLSHSNPGILFDHLLDQIQRYDNFIGPMVDSLKYLNPLAYDVLAFCIIEALANPAKQRMKQSDTNLSAWLQSLSQFCGAVFKKYQTEITGLLQYIANQLKAGKSLDLLVLKEVVQKMSGVESNDDITPQQLEALSGGEMIKSEGAYFSQIRNTRKPSVRLRDALMEGKLTIPLCLLIAQQRNAIVFVEEQQRHLKLIGKLYDQCQDNLIQFGGFLTIQLSTHDYKAKLPTLDEFHKVYAITPDVSFFLTRPVYRHEIQEKVTNLRQALSERKDCISSKQKQSELEKNFSETCDNIFRPIVESAIPLQAAKIWNNLSPLLYVTFWSLSMYDLYTPVERYEEEVTKLKDAINDVDDNKEITSSSKKKKEKERCQFLIEKLNDEKQVQLDHNKLVRCWLESRREAWFPSKLAKGETITQFLQLCIFPRCVFSAIDAVYCAKFIQTIHTLEAPNFSTLICFDRTFSDVSYIVASLTENEASRYGRFLCAMLRMVSRWHGDKKLYDKECSRFPGFLTILRATNSEKASYLDYENFRHVCHKWQYKLTKALILGIESKDYTQIRNTLLVLIKILPYYPQVQNLGQALERRIEKIIEDEKDKRHDLQALAIGYNGMLKARKASMVPENQFHLKEKEKLLENSRPLKAAAVTKQVKQETSESNEKIVKKEEVSKTPSEKRSTSKTEISHNASRSEREKVIIEEDSVEKKKASSRSPRHSAGTDKLKQEDNSGKERDRGDRSKDKDRTKEKDKRARTNSPSSEDIKKRKIAEDTSHKKEKEKSDSKKERKRTSIEPEIKESKRRKEDSAKKDKIKKDKSSKRT